MTEPLDVGHWPMNRLRLPANVCFIGTVQEWLALELSGLRAELRYRTRRMTEVEEEFVTTFMRSDLLPWGGNALSR